MFEFFKNFKIKRLKIEQLGRMNEKLFDLSLFVRGRYALTNFSEKFSIKRISRTSLESIQIETKANIFSLSLPANYKVLVDGDEIWNGLESGPSRFSLTWPKLPANLRILLPNQNQIRFSEIETPLFSKGSPIHWVAPSLGALTTHMLVVAALVLTPSLPERSPMKFSVDLIQSVKTQNSKTTSRSLSGEETLLASKNAARRLLQDFKISKKSGMMKAAGATQLDQAFSKKSENKFLKSWSIDQEIENLKENPLNLSDTQVRAALQPVYTKLKECYEDVLIHDSSLKGQPQVRIDVNQAGKIEAVNLAYLDAKASSLKSLKDCFYRAYQIVQLPKPNRDFQVVHTLVLNY